MGHRKLSGAVGGGLCAASFGLILASVASHLTGPELYLFLIMIFLLGAVMFVRARSAGTHVVDQDVQASEQGSGVGAAGPGHVEMPGTARTWIGRQAPARPPRQLPADIEAEIGEPSITGNLLRIKIRVGRKSGGRDTEGKYYVDAFAIEGQFPRRLLPGPWRVPWDDAPAGRPMYIPWPGADLRLAEWPDDRRYPRKPRGWGRARMTFLKAGDPVKRRKAWGTGPWQVVVRLCREGSDAYMDTVFDIRLESGQIVFQKA